jgi:hypothetical protein
MPVPCSSRRLCFLALRFVFEIHRRSFDLSRHAGILPSAALALVTGERVDFAALW